MQEFKKHVEPLLSKNEILHNLALGILHGLHESSKPNFMGMYFFKDSRAALVLLQTHPQQIILSQIQKLTERDLSEAAELLQEIDIPGLVGERQTVLYLSQKLADLKNQEASLKMDQRIYRLDKVKKSCGCGRSAGKSKAGAPFARNRMDLGSLWISLGSLCQKNKLSKQAKSFY